MYLPSAYSGSTSLRKAVLAAPHVGWLRLLQLPSMDLYRLGVPQSLWRSRCLGQKSRMAVRLVSMRGRSANISRLFSSNLDQGIEFVLKKKQLVIEIKNPLNKVKQNKVNLFDSRH